MNRPIKFRVWDSNHKKMTYPDTPVYSFFWNPYEKHLEIRNGVEDTFTEKTHVPLQFTGLQDAKEKDIYEGDIVSFRRLFEEQRIIKKLTSTVRYNEGKFGFDLIGFNGMFYDLSDDNVEVIGNIFENPELLA
jgi:uncharacterized phage protein (TIGR01671 family)